MSHLARLALLSLVASGPTSALAEPPPPEPLPAPWTVLGWGDEAGAPGWRPAGDETEALGPVAIAVGEDRVIISDPVHRQLLVVGGDGRVAVSVPIAFRAVALAALADGGLVVLDARGDRAHHLDPSGTWESTGGWVGAHPATGGALSGVARGPRGGAWMIDGFGHGWPLDTSTPPDPAGFERATPLDDGGRWHGAGRRVDAHTGEVLLWAWDESAELKAAGPRLRVPIAAPCRLLGSVRPLRVDARGVLHVYVETLTPGPRVAVRASVRRFDLGAQGAALAAFAWQVADIAPINRCAAVGPDGTLVVMAARPEGLTLWRLPPASSPSVGSSPGPSPGPSKIGGGR